MTFISNDAIKMQCVYNIVIKIMSNDVIEGMCYRGSWYNI